MTYIIKDSKIKCKNKKKKKIKYKIAIMTRNDIHLFYFCNRNQEKRMHT